MGVSRQPHPSNMPIFDLLPQQSPRNPALTYLAELEYNCQNYRKRDEYENSY